LSGNKIGDQLFVALTIFEGQNTNSLDTISLKDCGFDFPQFNPVTTDFDLMIDPP